MVSLMIVFSIIIYFVIVVGSINLISIGNEAFAKNTTSVYSCNCVIFRMDDVQDFWIDQAQIAPMNLFLSKNQSLTLGLIMNKTGDDSDILQNIKKGYQKGLFELALHGWDHVDFSNLSEQDQQYYLLKSNNKMKLLFGNNSNIFIPPYDPFNNDTIKAMSLNGIPIISSAGYEENIFNNNKSIFVSNDNLYNNSIKSKTIIHIPSTIAFKNYVNGSWIKTPLGNISDSILKNIKEYGYAVVVIHPQDFIKIDNNEFDVGSLNDLSFLIDDLGLKNIHITSFYKLVNYDKNYKNTH